MRRPTFIAWLALALLAIPASAQQPSPPPRDTLNSRLTGDLTPTHDPVIIRQGDTYHIFNTGHGQRLIETRTSPDLIHWTAGAPVFTALPDWAKEAIPGSDGMWAPDISYVNGRYRLYYSVSTFGSNRSAIGLATSPTLDPDAPDYHWRDEGMVVMSDKSDDFNAIDPNFIIDREGRHWLSLGRALNCSNWTPKAASPKIPRPDPSPSPGVRPRRVVRPRSKRPSSSTMAAIIG